MLSLYEAGAAAVKPIEAKRRQNPNRVWVHLTNERTDLACMQSAIALVGYSVLIVWVWLLRLPLAPNPPGNSWKLGFALAIAGWLAVLSAIQHHLAIHNDIAEDAAEPPDRWVVLFSLVVLRLCVGVIDYVFAIPLEMTSVMVE